MTHIFCVRHFNDIDNIAPIIYYYLKSYEADSVLLISYDKYDLKSDVTVNFLAKEFNERIIPVNLIECLNTPFNINLFVAKGLAGKIYRRYLKITGKVNSYNIKSKHFEYLYERLIEDFIAKYSVSSTVYFDQVRVHMVPGLIYAFKKKGFKLICLPVSPLTNINTVRMSIEGYCKRDIYAKDGIYDEHDYSIFDSVVYTDSLYYLRLEEYFDLYGVDIPIKSPRFLGSIRYMKKWIKLRSTYMNTTISTVSRTDEKPIIVFFLSRFKNNVFEDEVFRTIQVLSQFDEINVIIKPHPRNMEYLLKSNHKNIKLSKDDSSYLIDQADYIMTWGSSIFYEAMQKEKPIIYISYLHSNENILDLYDLGNTLNTRDDLIKIMEGISSGEKLINNRQNANIIRDNIIQECNDKAISNYLNLIALNTSDISKEIG